MQRNKNRVRCIPAFLIYLFLLPAGATISANLLANPRIDAPATGSTLSSSAQKFSWSINNDDADNAKIERVWLYVGTSVGARDIANSGDLGLNTEFDVIGMPQDGSTVHARLWFFKSDRWAYVDSSYSTTNNNVVITMPAITSPVSNSELRGASVKFEWSDNNTPVNFWWIYIGTNQGGKDLYDSSTNIRAQTSVTVDQLPTDGSTIHVRLWFRTNSDGWQFADTTYLTGDDSTDDGNNDLLWSANIDFNPSSLSTEAQTWHAEVIRLINDDSNNWAGDPDTLFSAANLNNCQTGGAVNSQGTYSYGRAGQSYVRALTNALAETGDIAILERVFELYQALWSNVADHDGRGYQFLYYARGNDTTHCGKDTHAMDEILTHSLLAHMARVFSHNEQIDSKYAIATTDIVNYLQNTWFPKWMGRTHPDGEYGSAPGANVTTSTWMNRTRFDSNMTLFVRGLTHPDMAGMELFYNLGELTGDTAFTDHSNSQCNWAKENLFETVVANNSYRFKHLPFNDYNDTGSGGLLNPYHETRDYAQMTMTFISSMVKEGWCFDSSDIERFGNTYYSGNARHDVFTAGDTDFMAEDVEGGNDAFNDDTFRFTGIAGKARFRMLSGAYLCGWDETGVIKDLATVAAQNNIVDQRYPSGNQTSPIMASGLLTCSD